MGYTDEDAIKNLEAKGEQSPFFLCIQLIQATHYRHIGNENTSPGNVLIHAVRTKQVNDKFIGGQQE